MIVHYLSPLIFEAGLRLRGTCPFIGKPGPGEGLKRQRASCAMLSLRQIKRPGSVSFRVFCFGAG